MNIDKSILAELKAEQQKPKRTKLQSDRNYYYRAFSDANEAILDARLRLEKIQQVLSIEALDAYDPETNEIDKRRQDEFQRIVDEMHDYIDALVDLDKKYGRLHHEFPEFSKDLK